MNQYLHKIILFWLLVLVGLPISAQISGRVTDAQTGEPMPYVNVYFDQKKQINVVTDVKGNYAISTADSDGLLLFSFVGYETHQEHVVRREKRTINVKLNPSAYMLDAVTVKPKRERYSRKNNPAVELMQKVIASKKQTDMEQNEYYRYGKYQKITTSLNNITQAAIDSGVLKNLPFLTELVEYCPQTEKHIIPINYNEKLTEHLFRRNPKEAREYVRGTNAKGFNDLFGTGDMVNTLISKVFTDVDVRDDNLLMLDRPFTSPLSSSSAISFYQYYIVDTLEVDREPCIRLTFVPRNPQDFGFSGVLYIVNDGTYEVKKCVLNLPVRSSVNFVNNLIIEQKFDKLSNGKRVLVSDDMFAELGVIKRQRSFMIQRKTAFMNYSFDSISPIHFEEKELLREGTFKVDDQDFWAQNRSEELTLGEQNMEHALQTAMRSKGFGVIMFVLKAAIENFVETAAPGKKNYVDIGPVNTLISTNFVEKYRVRASAQTTAHLNPHLFFKGYVAYGFEDKKVKYFGQAEYSFLKKQYSPDEFPRNSITASVQYDVMSPTDRLAVLDKDNIFSSMKTETIDQMEYYRAYLLRYVYEFNSTFSTRLQFRHMEEEPLGSLYYRTLAGEDIHKIRNSELALTLRYAPGEVLVNSKQRRHAADRNNPVFTLTHTSGFKGFLAGDYNYNVTELTLYYRIWMQSFGRMSVYLKGAAQWNKVPYPLLLMPAANNSYIIQYNMFNMMHNMEFLNDRYASLDISWDMNGKILNRIPLIKKLKWREIVGFRSLYGGLTSKNNPALNVGDNTLFEFPQREGIPMSRTMGDKPYAEFSVGIHNIFKCFRVDYVRRLNYLDSPETKKNGVRFVFQVDF